jgi:hypothetical protein
MILKQREGREGGGVENIQLYKLIINKKFYFLKFAIYLTLHYSK